MCVCVCVCVCVYVMHVYECRCVSVGDCVHESVIVPRTQVVDLNAKLVPFFFLVIIGWVSSSIFS